MKILVTGGAGFIGSNLVHCLLELGGEVLVIDDLSTGSADNLDPRAEFRKVDILDDGFLEASAAFAPEVIAHLAAQSSITVGEADPALTRRVNIEGTRHVIEAAKAANAQRLVFASTAAVYGTKGALPLVEPALLAPENIYGETKLAGEELIRRELDATDTDYALLRFSNVYGPRQSAQGEGGVVACFCGALVDERLPVIYGDGQQVRDFVYVADVVMALVSAIGGDIAFAAAGSAAADGRSDDRGAFNISTGQPTTVEQLLNYLRAPSNFFREPEHAPDRPGDIRENMLSPQKAFDTFQWRASTDLDKGLEITWLWYSHPK